MQVRRVVYVSRASGPHDLVCARSILRSSRLNNVQFDITGCLLYSGRCFAQVIEGPPEAVTRLLRRIAADYRHTDLAHLKDEPDASRCYGPWAMGYIHDPEMDETLLTLLERRGPSDSRIARLLPRIAPEAVTGALP